MYIKIYFGDKPLYLTDTLSPDLEPLVHHDDTILIEELSAPAVKSMIYEMELPGIHAGVFLHPDLEAVQKAFWKKFELIQAGGGAVWNERQELLFIHRRGKWDLPKGKLDEGETIEACAQREVEEETGLKGVQLLRPLITTYHTYHESGKHILKESAWFEMRASADQALVPQVIEDIHAVEWLAKDKWQKVLDNTFPSVRDVLEALDVSK
jgi:8-oxo-dGTP pyrophosphatase MutT (NUDIX family)